MVRKVTSRWQGRMEMKVVVAPVRQGWLVAGWLAGSEDVGPGYMGALRSCQFKARVPGRE